MKGIIITAAAVAVLFAAAVICRIMRENYVSIRSQHLQAYSYGSGGGMNGGYHTEKVKRYDDRVLISIVSADWFAQDPTVTEYLTDAAVLEELESVVRKYQMNFWDGKKFTDMIIYDGESERYDFDFDDADISFSSQYYPMKYRNKLGELDSVIRKYIETGEKLPGLVNPKTDEEENTLLPEDELVIYVYSYIENSLGLKILNGTYEEAEIAGTYQLINTDTDTVLLEKDTPDGGRFSGRTIKEMNIRLEERLPAGNYQIIFENRVIPFEIR